MLQRIPGNVPQRSSQGKKIDTGNECYVEIEGKVKYRANYVATSQR